jgi:hypothetical protein
VALPDNPAANAGTAKVSTNDLVLRDKVWNARAMIHPLDDFTRIFADSLRRNCGQKAENVYL